MAVYDYSPITYHVTGMSVINDLEKSGQEGILVYLRSKDGDKLLELFLDKHSCAHLAKMTKAGRMWWKRFQLPKMREQK